MGGLITLEFCENIWHENLHSDNSHPPLHASVPRSWWRLESNAIKWGRWQRVKGYRGKTSEKTDICKQDLFDKPQEFATKFFLQHVAGRQTWFPFRCFSSSFCSAVFLFGNSWSQIGGLSLKLAPKRAVAQLGRIITKPSWGLYWKGGYPRWKLQF